MPTPLVQQSPPVVEYAPGHHNKGAQFVETTPVFWILFWLGLFFLSWGFYYWGYGRGYQAGLDRGWDDCCRQR